MSSALEKREARVGPSYILAVVALFLPCIGTCGGLGAYKAHVASSRVVEASIRDVESTPAGTFVATDAKLSVVGAGQLPFDDASVIVARGATLFSVAGSAKLVVYCEGSACAGLDGQESGAQVHVAGQVCKGDESFLCTVPKPLDLYLRREAHLGRPHRAILAGATPRGSVWEAAVGLGIALFLAFAAAATLTVATRTRTGARLQVERSLAIRGGREAARAALEARRSKAWRLADDRGYQLTFLAGAEASKTRVIGVRSADDVSRRVAIRFEEQPAYRAGVVTITVTEILPFPGRGGVPKHLRPMVLDALNQTLSEVERLLVV